MDCTSLTRSSPVGGHGLCAVRTLECTSRSGVPSVKRRALFVSWYKCRLDAELHVTCSSWDGNAGICTAWNFCRLLPAMNSEAEERLGEASAHGPGVRMTGCRADAVFRAKVG
jgi:hypothetical protein